MKKMLMLVLMLIPMLVASNALAFDGIWMHFEDVQPDGDACSVFVTSMIGQPESGRITLSKNACKILTTDSYGRCDLSMQFRGGKSVQTIQLMDSSVRPRRGGDFIIEEVIIK